MSNPSALGAICYEPETNFGEDVTTFATLRVPIIGAVDAQGLKQDKMDANRTVQRRQDGTQWTLGTKSGTFKTKLWLTGHGSSTSGATTATQVETLIGKVFGGFTATPPAGTTLTGGTSSVPITTASGTFAAGSLCRIGTLNDARGNGQMLAIATHITTNLTLLTAMDGAPNAGDVLYSVPTVNSTEDPINGTAITSCRFLLQTANLCYEAHGCVATAIVFSGLNTGQVPAVEITWTVSWWRYSTATFPSAVSTEIALPAPNAAGSLFMNVVGTATRAKRTFRDFTLTYKLGVAMLPGPGGADPFQVYVGARRTVDVIDVSWVEDADSPATTTPVLPGLGTGTAAQHMLWTGNPTATKSMGIYLPNICITNVALQYADANINRLKITARAYTGPTVTNDLTASAFRMGFA